MPTLEVRHYTTVAGRDVIAEFLDKLPLKAAARCSAVIGWLESGELDLHPKARKHLDGTIWELRVRHDGEEYRFLYAVEAGTAHLLVPVHKMTQKAERDDIARARQRFDEVRGRSGAP